MCAGTVVAPAVATSAGSVSITSRSRSVAFRLRRDLSALTRTLPRIGMVLRRSAARWTWPSDFISCARSTVTFMPRSTTSKRSAARRRRRRSESRRMTKDPPRGAQGGADRLEVQGQGGWLEPHFPGHLEPLAGASERRKTACPINNRRSNAPYLLLQQALQQLDLVGQRRVLADQPLDLAHRVQHGGVIAA